MGPVDYTNTLGTSIYMENAKKLIFKKFHNSYDPSPNNILGLYNGMLRTSGAFLTGLGLAAITIVTKVITIGEIIFKGFENLLQGEFKSGLKKLLLALPCAAIDLAIGGPLHAAYNLVVDTLGLAIKPQDYSHYMKKWHKGKKARLEDAEVTLSATLRIEKFLTEKIGLNPKNSLLEMQMKIFTYIKPRKAMSECINLINNLIYGQITVYNY